jgi:hypothetical protein
MRTHETQVDRMAGSGRADGTRRGAVVGAHVTITWLFELAARLRATGG